MDQNKPPKKGFSDVESFARKHLPELFMAFSIALASLSAWADFFMGTAGWSVLLLTVGSIVGIFFPAQVEQVLRKIHSGSLSAFTSKEMMIEGIRFAVAIFLPFIYFGFLGLMIGTCYHHYVKKPI